MISRAGEVWLIPYCAAGRDVYNCGKEISPEVLELHATTIFQQAEIRLHAQKAILVALAR
jgi:ornithine carbamoyltransferase